MISSKALYNMKSDVNKITHNIVPNNKQLQGWKSSLKHSLLDSEAIKNLQGLDNNCKHLIFLSILDHKLEVVQKLLNSATFSIANLKSHEIAMALLYSNHPWSDSTKLFSGYKVFTDTAEKFLFVLFNSTNKRDLIKNIVINIKDKMEENPMKLREFINTYMNHAEIAHHNASFFASMYALGIRQFYNLNMSLTIMPETFADVEFIKCKFGNMKFADFQNVKFSNCTINQGSKFIKVENSLFSNCKFDNASFDEMNNVVFIDCIETHYAKVHNHISTSNKFTTISRNKFNKLNDITFYRDDGDYTNISIKLQPFIIEDPRCKNPIILKHMTVKESIMQDSLVYPAIKDDICVFTLTPFTEFKDNQPIIIVVSITAHLSKDKYSYFFYDAKSFEMYFNTEYNNDDNNIKQIFIPQTRGIFVTSISEIFVPDTSKIYYTFYKRD